MPVDVKSDSEKQGVSLEARLDLLTATLIASGLGDREALQQLANEMTNHANAGLLGILNGISLRAIEPKKKD